MLNPALFPTKYFPTGDFQPIVLPIASIRAALEQKQAMADFHDGIGEIDEKVVGTMKIQHSAIHDKKMIACVNKGKSGIIPFGRKGLTNFAEARIKLLSIEQLKALGIDSETEVFAFCSEMVFTLFKRQCSTTKDDPNFESVTNAILLAPTPLEAKKATGQGKLAVFDAEKWDTISTQAMYLATIMRCTDETQFDLFKSCVKTMRDEGAETFLVIEANPGDAIWGINRSTKDLLDELYTTSTAEEEDLIATATKLFRGRNQLGQVLTDFMLAIEPIDYQAYMRALEGVQFVVAE